MNIQMQSTAARTLNALRYCKAHSSTPWDSEAEATLRLVAENIIAGNDCELESAYRWIPGKTLATQLFPNHDTRVKESKAATRQANRCALDVFIREPGTKRGKHVFSITDQSA